MAVAHSTSSASHASASFSVSQASFSWTHTESTDPQYVLVMVFQGVSGTDAATSVTYGGTTVPALSGGFAQDTATEPGSCKIFFLGSGVPTTNNPTVVVNRTNNTTSMWAVCVTGTAAKDCEAVGIVLLQENGTYAVQSVDDESLSGTNSVRYAGAYYGGASPAPAGTGSTLLHSNDAGNYGWSAVRETTAGIGARNVGFTQATSDDRAGVHFAVREVVPAAKYDTSSSQSGLSTASISWSHTCTGTNRVLVVDVAVGSIPETGMTSAVTYNGVSMTSISKRHAADNVDGYLERFVLINPASGANTVAVTISGGTPASLIGGAMSFNNASQTIGDYTVVSAVANTANASVTTSSVPAASSVVMGGHGGGTGFTTVGQTSRYNIDNTAGPSGCSALVGNTTLGDGSANKTMTANMGATDFWVSFVTEIKIFPTISFVADMGLQAGNTLFWPGGQAIGDLAIAHVANKLSSTTPSTPSGWTSLGSVVVGTGADGAGTGPIRLTSYYMVLATSSPANPAFGSGFDVIMCGGEIWRKTGGTWATPVQVTGDDTTTGTGFSATGAAINPKVGDWITAFTASTANATVSSGRPSLTVSGWTLTGTGLNSGGTATGNDLFVWVDYASVDSGSGTGAPTQTATYAASTSGGTAFVKVGLGTGGLSAGLTTATETDSAQAIGRISVLALPKATETDSAQALGRVKKYAALTIATETDSAIAVAAITKKLLSPVAQETDSARTIHYPVKVPVSNETDAAQAIARIKKKSVPIAAETDTAITLARTKKLVVPIAQETDSAQAVGRISVRLIPIATETDAAQALARRHTKLIPLAAETDTARTIVRLSGFQTAQETDTAIALSRISILAIQTALATDAARPVNTLRSRTVTVATTTDSAQAIAARSTRLLPIATETDVAQALGRISKLALPTSLETDLARTLGASSIKAVPLASEADTAIVLGRVSTRLLPVASETGLARLLAGKKVLLLPTATELDEARTIANGPLVFIDISVEIGPSRSRALVLVVEESRHDWTVDDSRKSVDVGESRDRPSAAVGESRDRSMLDVGATRPSWEVGDSRHSTEVGESRQERG